jgi:hypothetical protein
MRNTTVPLIPHDRSLIEAIACDDLQCPQLRFGFDHWKRLRGDQRFPSRDAVRLSDLRGAAGHMILVKVIDGGIDFELRIVGQSAEQAFRVRLHRALLSHLSTQAPKEAELARKAYRRVIRTGVPAAYRMHVGSDLPEVRFKKAEFVQLPLGSGAQVDHVLTFLSAADFSWSGVKAPSSRGGR